MRKAYIFDHWNQFDLFIITLAAADLVIDHLFERSEHKVRAVRVFRLIRLARVLRLLKQLRSIVERNHQDAIKELDD